MFDRYNEPARRVIFMFSEGAPGAGFGVGDNGCQTAIREEDGSAVFSFELLHKGHRIRVAQRVRLSRDGRTLSCAQDVSSPESRQEYKHTMDFDIS